MISHYQLNNTRFIVLICADEDFFNIKFMMHSKLIMKIFLVGFLSREIYFEINFFSFERKFWVDERLVRFFSEDVKGSWSGILEGYFEVNLEGSQFLSSLSMFVGSWDQERLSRILKNSWNKIDWIIAKSFLKTRNYLELAWLYFLHG